MRLLHVAALPVAVVLAAAGIYFTLRPHTVRLAKAPVAPKPQPVLPTTRPALKAYVEAHKNDRDPKAQDLVGAARLRIAFDSAGKHDWKGARAELIDAAKQYKGTNTMSSDFGGVPDQAQYQAAVCLVAEGKKAEARAEFLRFMRERPLSPLVTAAFRRIQRIDGKADEPQVEALLQADVAKQEKHVRFELSACGPKALEHLLTSGFLRAKDGSKPDYKRLAELCGTTDQGTTILELRKGLKRLGIESYGYRLNAPDLAKAPMPAIAEETNHFLVIEKISLGKARIFDPRDGTTYEKRLPTSDVFSVPVILFSLPDLPNA